MDVASFLLTCTSTLPNAEEISQQLLGGGDDNEEDEDMEDVEKKKDDNNKVEDTKPAATSSNKSTNDPQTTLLQSVQASQQHPTFATTNNEIIEVSCINPRGKFQLSIYKSGIILTNPKKPEEVIPISNNVSNVVWFRKPEDYKKMKQLAKNGGGSGGKKDKGIPGHMVLICLEEGTMFRNKPLKQVCFQLPTYPSQSAEGDNNSTQLNEKSWWNGLSSSLFTEDKATSGIIRVNASMETGKSSNGFVFKSAGEQGSSSTTEGLPFVGCYQGFNDGALFPLKEGLLFFKPPMFVPRSELASISCGRGAGGSRYVDMEVKLDVSDDDEQEGKKKKQLDTLEWSNINRDELEGLNNYIHKTLIPAMQLDADGEEASDGNSSNDDDDFAVAEVANTSDDEEKIGSDDDDSADGSKKRRPSRAASKSAREINKAALAGGNEEEDSDDDSDEFEEEEDSDKSSDEESVVSDKSDQGGSSSEEEDFEQDEEGANDSGSDYRESKKARVE